MTGSSPGSIVTEGGKKQRVSLIEGQGVITARATKALGPRFIEVLNNASRSSFTSLRSSLKSIGVKASGAFTLGIQKPSDGVGGIVSGPGTGTSDSVPGVIVDSQGKPKRGLRLSDKEGILTARVVRGLGSGAIDKINSASTTVLTKVRKLVELSGYKAGGLPTINMSGAAIAQAATAGYTMAPLAMAGGGVIDSSGMTSSTTTANSQTNGSVNTFNTNVNITADEDTGIDADTLNRLNDGVNSQIRDYVAEQLRPGGLLQSARGGVGR